MRLKASMLIKPEDIEYDIFKQKVNENTLNIVITFNSQGNFINIVESTTNKPVGLAWYEGDNINIVGAVIPLSDFYMVRLFNRNEYGGFDIPSQSVITQWSCKSDYFVIPSHLRFELNNIESMGIGHGYAVINKLTQKVVRVSFDSCQLPSVDFEGGVISSNAHEITVACVFANAGVNTSYLFKG